MRWVPAKVGFMFVMAAGAMVAIGGAYRMLGASYDDTFPFVLAQQFFMGLWVGFALVPTLLKGR